MHQTGRPFDDPSGHRLRQWLGVSRAAFYDSGVFAIVPMAFCFPGYDGSGKTGKGGDLPPRPECAERWRREVLSHFKGKLDAALLIGGYAQAWHLGDQRKKTLTETVKAWRTFESDPATGAKLLVLPHPSWRNTGWLRNNPWFEEEVIPVIQGQVRSALETMGWVEPADDA